MFVKRESLNYLQINYVTFHHYFLAIPPPSRLPLTASPTLPTVLAKKRFRFKMKFWEKELFRMFTKERFITLK